MRFVIVLLSLVACSKAEAPAVVDTDAAKAPAAEPAPAPEAAPAADTDAAKAPAAEAAPAAPAPEAH